MSKKPTKIFIQEKNDPQESSRENTQIRLRRKLLENEQRKAAERAQVTSDASSNAISKEKNTLSERRLKEIGNVRELSNKLINDINQLLVQAIKTDQFRHAEDLLAQISEKMIELSKFSAFDDSDTIMNLRYRIVNNIKNIYERFINDNIEHQPIEATKILIKLIKFYKEIYERYKIIYGNLLIMIFDLSTKVIEKYVRVSAESTAKEAETYGCIDDFLELEQELSNTVLGMWADYVQLVKVQIGPNYKKRDKLSNEDQQIINLEDKKLTHPDYYIYIEALSSALLNHVHNTMGEMRLRKIEFSLELLKRMEEFLKYGLKVIRLIPLHRLIEFSQNSAYSYNYYGNPAKIYARLVIVNYLQINTSIINFLKQYANEIYIETSNDKLINLIAFSKKFSEGMTEKSLPFDSMLENYTHFINNADLYIKKMSEIDKSFLADFPLMMDPKLEIGELLKNINDGFSGLSEKIFWNFFSGRNLNIFALVQKFVPLLMKNVEYGASALAHTVIKINLQVLDLYIRIDEIDEAKALYIQSVVLYKLYSQRYPQDFQEFNLELTNRFNHYLFILYDELSIPKVSNQDLIIDRDKEQALIEYQKLIPSVLAQHNSTWTIIETVSGTAFHLEIADNLNQLASSDFIIEFVKYLQQYLHPDSISCTANTVTILGYSIVAVGNAIKNIERFKAIIFPPQKETVALKQTIVLPPSFVETNSDNSSANSSQNSDNSSANSSQNKETARVRKQKKLKEAIEFFYQKQVKQQEITKTKLEMRKQQKQQQPVISASGQDVSVEIETSSSASTTVALAQQIPIENNNPVVTKTLKQATINPSASSSSTSFQKGFFNKTQKKIPVKSSASSTKPIKIVSNIKQVLNPTEIVLVSTLPKTQALLFANIQLNMRQIECLFTVNTALEERVQYTNLQAYIRQVFLSLMVWDEYHYYVNLKGSNPIWARYRHGIVHQHWDINLLQKIAEALKTYLSSNLAVEQLPQQCQALEKQLSTLIVKEHLTPVYLELSEYRKRIEQELLHLHHALSTFNLNEEEGIKQLQHHYELWNYHLSIGRVLDLSEYSKIQKFVMISESLANMGEYYAQLKKLTDNKTRRKLFPEANFLEFLANCKNIYRNELCHNILFTTLEPVDSYMLSSCQIFEAELMRDCRTALQLALQLLPQNQYSISAISIYPPIDGEQKKDADENKFHLPPANFKTM